MIPRQRDSNLALAWCNQQGPPHAAEFSDMTHEDAIDKYCGAIRIHLKLDLCCDLWQLDPGIFFHPDVDGLRLSAPDRDLLYEVHVAALPDCDLVFAGKQ